ncbi:cytochrome c oxidase subunit 2 [Saccharomonospora amisosensis]|uniref:Cytochrome aa3 subunit 2 n=1 Tax=Saccharomonospora amisosensis TaxID=1128677 RepID=A0A7X5UPM1_9PSEU|nr:cytochrome c oxidase subunit II [Saccharomonospora amisosensis]NIJ11850.1 cytochrome c oxidase subunit 2 [Saccharomonospora amisosensis]
MSFLEVFQRTLSWQAVVASVVFGLIALTLLGTLAVSRRRSPDRRRRDSRPVLEGVYALLLAGTAGVIVYVTASAHQEVRTGETGYHVSNRPGAVRVDVTAFQWCWQFDYADTGKSVTGTCREGNEGLPTLVVPTGRPVELRLTSNDVVHALWIPDLAVKLDTYPDHTNTLTMSFDREGRWLGRCAEFCGEHHPAMHFNVRAVAPQEYQQWLQQGPAA